MRAKDVDTWALFQSCFHAPQSRCQRRRKIDHRRFRHAFHTEVEVVGPLCVHFFHMGKERSPFACFLGHVRQPSRSFWMSIKGDPGRGFPTFTIKRRGILLSMPVSSSLSPICLFFKNKGLEDWVNLNQNTFRFFCQLIQQCQLLPLGLIPFNHQERSKPFFLPGFPLYG